MTIEQQNIQLYDQWLNTEKGRFLFSRQKKIIVELTAPNPGCTVLNVGCRAGHYLRLFRDEKCAVSGTDRSEILLGAARERLGTAADLRRARPEELPFADNEFDLVTLIHVLETCADPQRALAEAIRVSRRLVFIGLMNPHALFGTKQRIKALVGLPISGPTRYFRRRELALTITKVMDSASITWGSAIYLPDFFYTFFSELEEALPWKNNPLGAFVGMVFPVKYTYRTAQNPILSVFDMKAKSAQATAPEAVRGMMRETDV
ncbi:MAG: class I SAM-dependent methyltransferase [Smithellaceae bacterium]